MRNTNPGYVPSLRFRNGTASLHGSDLAAMLEKQKTFDEALASEDFSIFERQRLNIIKNEMFQTIETAQIV